MENRSYGIEDLQNTPVPEARPMTPREMLIVLGKYNRKIRRTAAALLRRKGDRKQTLEQVFEHITGMAPMTTAPESKAVR